MMQDPHLDSWAALHLPAIEQLLRNLPDEEYRSTGIGDSEGSFFQSVVNATPYSAWPEPGLAKSPEDLRCGPMKLDLYSLESNLTGHGPRLLGSPKEGYLQSGGNELKNASPPKAPTKGSAAEGESTGLTFVEGFDLLRPLGKSHGPIGHRNVPKRINIQEEFATDACEITTAMIRNVPNQLNRKQFVERLDQLGFSGLYDFVYVPMDRATRMNVGYAFVNFVDPESFRLCESTLQGKKFIEKEEGEKRRSGKPIIVCCTCARLGKQ